jgi:hypothetical protein
MRLSGVQMARMSRLLDEALPLDEAGRREDCDDVRAAPCGHDQCAREWIRSSRYVVALLTGIPTYVLFRKKHLDRWWHFVAGGAALGCLPGICLIIYDLFAGANSWFEFITLAVGIPYGAVAGLAFWMISVHKCLVRSRV